MFAKQINQTETLSVFRETDTEVPSKPVQRVQNNWDWTVAGGLAAAGGTFLVLGSNAKEGDKAPPGQEEETISEHIGSQVADQMADDENAGLLPVLLNQYKDMGYLDNVAHEDLAARLQEVNIEQDHTMVLETVTASAGVLGIVAVLSGKLNALTRPIVKWRAQMEGAGAGAKMAANTADSSFAREGQKMIDLPGGYQQNINLGIAGATGSVDAYAMYDIAKMEPKDAFREIVETQMRLENIAQELNDRIDDDSITNEMLISKLLQGDMETKLEGNECTFTWTVADGKIDGVEIPPLQYAFDKESVGDSFATAVDGLQKHSQQFNDVDISENAQFMLDAVINGTTNTIHDMTDWESLDELSRSFTDVFNVFISNEAL